MTARAQATHLSFGAGAPKDKPETAPKDKPETAPKDKPGTSADVRELLVGLVLAAGLAVLSATWWFWVSH
jgi:hypothetical protein